MPHDRARRIALVGLRGAGKSTLGQHLAERLGCPFIELDRLVEQDYGARIPDLIEMAGLATFRRYERACLERVIDEHEAAVIATAGGIVSNPETYALLLRRTHTVWIKARPEEHMRRVMEQGDFRPMAQNREAMADLVAILDARRADYARAQAELDTSGDTVERASRNSRRSLRVAGTERRNDAARRPGLSRSRRHAARIPHDRSASGSAADPRAAARRARLRRRVGQLSAGACGRDRRRRVRLFARRLRQLLAVEAAASVAFMHEEAQDVLPRVLDAIGFRRGLLVGHSDGASIAAIYAGSVQDHRVRGLVLMAPHFFTEDMGIAEIARAKVAFETGTLRGKLARCTPIPTTRSTTGATPGSIPSSANGTSPTRSPTSACRS